MADKKVAIVAKFVSPGTTGTPSLEDQAEELSRVARELAKALGETKPNPQDSIARIVRTYGVAFAQEHYKRAAEIQASGGLRVPEGRRRTFGGVFFFLVRQTLGATAFYKVSPGGRTYLREARRKQRELESSKQKEASQGLTPGPAFEQEQGSAGAPQMDELEWVEWLSKDVVLQFLAITDEELVHLEEQQKLSTTVVGSAVMYCRDDVEDLSKQFDRELEAMGALVESGLSAAECAQQLKIWPERARRYWAAHAETRNERDKRPTRKRDFLAVNANDTESIERAAKALGIVPPAGKTLTAYAQELGGTPFQLVRAIHLVESDPVLRREVLLKSLMAKEKQQGMN